MFYVLVTHVRIPYDLFPFLVQSIFATPSPSFVHDLLMHSVNPFIHCIYITSSIYSHIHTSILSYILYPQHNISSIHPNVKYQIHSFNATSLFIVSRPTFCLLFQAQLYNLEAYIISYSIILEFPSSVSIISSF